MDELMNQDLFSRHQFAESMMSVVKSVPTPFTFGLDAPWGAGKTYFINHVLSQAAADNDIPFAIYDAFEHEKETDVLVSLVSTVLEQLKDLPQKRPSEIALKKVAATTAKVAVTTLKIAGNAAAKYVLRSSLDELQKQFDFAPEAEHILASELEGSIAKFIFERSTEGKSYKNIKALFQQSITELAESTGNNKRILLVIDELDRCSPRHALAVLEAIHHLLNAEGLVILFSFHREQLERIVEHTYGIGINSSNYLQKFINYDFSFPPVDYTIIRQAHIELSKRRAEKHQNKNLEKSQTFIFSFQFFNGFSRSLTIQPRDVERFTSVLLVAIEHCKKSHSFLSTKDFSILTTWKVINSEILRKIVKEGLNDENIKGFRNELKIDLYFGSDNSPDDLILKLFVDEQIDEITRRHLIDCIREFSTLS